MSKSKSHWHRQFNSYSDYVAHRCQGRVRRGHAARVHQCSNIPNSLLVAFREHLLGMLVRASWKMRFGTLLKCKADLEALCDKPSPESCLKYEVVPQVTPPSARQHCSGERTCKHGKLLGAFGFQPAHSYASGSVLSVSRRYALERYKSKPSQATYQVSLSPTVRVLRGAKSLWVVSSTFLLLLVLGRSFSKDSSKDGILSSPLPEVDASAPAAALHVTDALVCSQGRQCLHPGDL